MPMDSTQVDVFIQDLMRNGSIPGMTLGVVRRDDSAVEMLSFGIRNEDGEEMTSDVSSFSAILFLSPDIKIRCLHGQTLFSIASLSKAFLASSFGILMDDFANDRNATPLPEGLGTLGWRTKIKDVLPDDWKLMDAWTTEMADFRDVFSHQTGFPR